MFFIMGISTKEKDIEFSQTTLCPRCGAYGRLEAFMTYRYFSLFFIKIFKWNKKYYIRSSCCNSLYTIDPDLGQDLEKGLVSKINDSDLNPVDTNHREMKSCGNCGYPINSEFEYCPKCGVKL